MVSNFFNKFCFNIFALIIFVVISLTFSSAVLNSESAVLDVTLIVPIDFEVHSGGSLSYLNVDFVMVPITDSRQKVLSYNYNIEPSEIEEGLVKFRITNPVDTSILANYKLETNIYSSKVFEKINFPLENLDPSFSKYVASSDIYDINKDIESLAINLAGDETDLFKVVFNLAEWVNRNVVYDLSTVSNEQLSASWVLENKVGVCTEYTSLFIALARSLGIPVREVSGFAYTESELFPRGWEFHSWTEVFFPGYGWVPFDPTYGQYGFVDAGHVQLGLSEEGIIEKNSFSWRSKNVDVIIGQSDLAVNILSLKNSQNVSNLEVDAFILEEHVGVGSYNFIRLDLYNNNPFYVVESIRMSGVDGLSFLSPRFKSVILAPYESQSIYFIFNINKDLMKGFMYTFPLRFYLNNELFSYDFKASTNAVIISKDDVLMFLDEKKLSEKTLSCSVTPIVRVNESIEISCESLNEEGVLCFDNICDSFGKDESLNINVSVFEPGLFTKTIVFDSRTDSYVSFLRFVVLDDASLDLSRNIDSEIVNPDDFVLLNLSLKKESLSVPENVSLSIIHKHFRNDFFVDEILNEYIVSFSFPARNLRKGTNELIIEVTFFDSLGKKYVQEQTFLVDVEGLSLLDEIDFFFRRIYFWVVNLW